MPSESVKILGIYNASASTEAIYVVPQNRRAVISRIYINAFVTSPVISLAIVPGGNGNLSPGASNKHYLLRDFTLNIAPTGSQPIFFEKIALSSGDDIRFTSNQNDAICHVYGIEIIPDSE